MSLVCGMLLRTQDMGSSSWEGTFGRGVLSESQSTGESISNYLKEFIDRFPRSDIAFRRHKVGCPIRKGLRSPQARP